MSHLVGLSEEVARLRRRVRAALGEEPADLVLRDCRVVNTYSEEIHAADIAVLDGRIVAVRDRFDGESLQEYDCGGRFALPGLVEPQFYPMLVGIEAAREALANGTTSVVGWGPGHNSASPDELGNVPWRVYGVAESGLPTGLRFTPVSLTEGLSFADGQDLLTPLRHGRTLMLTDTGNALPLLDMLADIVARALDTRHICLGETESKVYRPFLAALAAGVPLLRAVQMAGLNAATHYGINHEIGSLSPGRWADIVLLAELDRFPPDRVYVGGTLVASAGTPRW
ncbi:amidohydrolase family protein [Actinocrispum wychmicini]|uniref:Amidohydrolase family protein n=1 Tax=Actinocrispum wychmicini TaxID=1213861 RepID=A0A4R2JTV5_9PSEU|nr:amidohydrolase family protein [Actinocrispum wychmicini]TCO60728.1 amidohydrolase family protein [Actinocrispum wychmicini]